MLEMEADSPEHWRNRYFHSHFLQGQPDNSVVLHSVVGTRLLHKLQGDFGNQPRFGVVSG